MASADVAQLRALVEAHRRLDSPQRVLAVRHEPAWSGPATIEAGEFQIRVATASSPLGVREVMHELAPAGNDVLVVLTDCDRTDLGLDLRARLIKHDVVSLDPHKALRALFGCELLDPALAEDRWLVEDLVAIAPVGGFRDRRPLAGVLDVEHAWRVWQEVRLGLAVPPEDLEDLLGLSSRPVVGAALQGLPEDRRQMLARRWSPAWPAAGRLVVELLASGQRDEQVLAVALVAGVLWAESGDERLSSLQTIARARLEYLYGRDVLGRDDASALAAAACRMLRVGESGGVLEAAERLLEEAGAEELAVLSDVLASGFEMRLAKLGEALLAGDTARAEQACSLLASHQQARREPRRLERAEAALRLARRGLAPWSGAASLAEAARSYAGEGSYVEQARRLVDEGDVVPEFAAACSRLSEAASSWCLEGDRRLASLVVDWSGSSSKEVIGVESLLSEVVAPVARVAPVLLVVCDGMGWSVAHRLLGELRDEGWPQVLPAERHRWPVGVVVLPSVTEVSRTSLLCGELRGGGQAEEREGFSHHAGLRAASLAARPPVLFHKADLVGIAGDALGEQVLAAVADPGQQVVGVVVNAVDDHLAKGEQIAVSFGLEAIRPLRFLLEAASSAGRAVVITADHGHVLRRAESRQSRPAAAGGERWRKQPPPPGDGEVAVSGHRVLLGGGSVVLPYDDRIVYGTHKHGYHGGASAEELLVPVSVHARVVPDAWAIHPDPVPTWCSGLVTAAAEPVAEPMPEPVLAPTRTTKGQANAPTLFDTDPYQPAPSDPAFPAPVVRRTWVDDLLSSAAFSAQRQRVRLVRPLSDEQLRLYLTPVALNGNAMPLQGLSSVTGEPIDTLRMRLSQVERLVNLDGDEVLAIRSDGTVQVNYELLCYQFELRASS